MQKPLYFFTLTVACCFQLGDAVGQTYNRFELDPDFGRFEGTNTQLLADNSRYAEVVSNRTIIKRIKTIVSETRCDTVERHVDSYRYDQSGNTGAVIGGVLGAVVGNNAASRKHRALGALGGAIVGSSIGREVGELSSPEPRVVQEVRECVTRPVERWRDEVVGYEVTYVYAGRSYSTTLRYNPGRALRVDLAGRPY